MLLNIILFLAVLSLLIFFHELGHFLAAKACGIYVDRFSIGMPPRIFGLRLGETDYCVGALPIGGFVKMAGQEDAPMTEEEREEEYGNVPPDRWFNKKPVWQRYIVIVAGPLMNLVLAVLLYGLIAAWGENVPRWEVSSRIGEIEPDSPAMSAPLYEVRPDMGYADYEGEPDAAGWKTGDVVTAMDGNPIRNITDLAVEAILGGEGALHYAHITRSNPDDTTTRYISPIRARIIKEDGEEDGGHPRFGVMHFEEALVARTLEDMPAVDAGLREDDVIARANGEIVDRYTLQSLIEDTPPGDEITLTIVRGGEVGGEASAVGGEAGGVGGVGGERVECKIVPTTIGRLRHVGYGAWRNSKAEEPGDAEPIVVMVEKDYRESTGLQPKDVIIAVNGAPATVESLSQLEQENPGGALVARVQRPAVLFGLIQAPAELDIELPVSEVRAIGIAFGTTEVFRRTPLPEVIPEAFRRSYEALERTLLTLKALVARDVSPKDLGGPFMIYDVTIKAAQAGFGWLVKITAFISINLCVFNLLPLPVLDGGLLLMSTIEGIRRKPLSAKFQERFQMVGLVLIVGLMLYVTMNDIVRKIVEITP